MHEKYGMLFMIIQLILRLTKETFLLRQITVSNQFLKNQLTLKSVEANFVSKFSSFF